MAISEHAPVDVIYEIEDQLELFVSPLQQIQHQIVSNTWATLLSNQNKRECYRDLEMKVRGYSRNIIPIKENYCFFSNHEETSPKSLVSDALMHQIAKLKLQINFDTNKVEDNGAIIYTVDFNEWKGLSEQITLAIFEEIETKLNRAALSNVLFLHYESSPPLFRSFIHTLMKNPNIAVYIFYSLPVNPFENELLSSDIDVLRSVGTNCYVIEQTLDTKKLM